MNSKMRFIDDETPAYKKKSKKKGQPRSKHKHIYETVLLTHYYHFDWGNSENVNPVKVCIICGRIEEIDKDESLWEKHPDPNAKPWMIWGRELSEKALGLPKWYVNDFDKFAIREEDVYNE